MFISPTNNTNFKSGNVKLIGFKADDMSKNFRQIYDFAKRKQIDFSIIKLNDKKSPMTVDLYTIIASKEVGKTSHKLYGTSLSRVNKSANKDFITLKILNSILEAIDIINEKLHIKPKKSPV